MASVTALSPKLRMVQGDPFTPQTEDMQGNRMVVKNGPNAGDETQAFVVTAAIAKTDPEAVKYIKQLCGIAAAAKPALWPRGVIDPPANFPPKRHFEIAALFGCSHPQYALKVQDGDGFDGNGAPNSTKEGHAGHWIIKFSQPSAPKVYEAGNYDNLQRVDIDPAKHSLLKKGFFVRVGAQVQDNGNDQRPGLYLNPSMVEIMHAGPEIITGPDAATIFGGASPAPAAPAPSAPTFTMTGTAGAFTREQMHAAGWTDDGLIAAGHMLAPVAAAPLPPSPATPPAAPPAPTPPAAPPAPTGATPSPSNPPYDGYMKAGPTRVMLPAAGAYSYEDLVKAGWTDAMLVDKGMMRIDP